MLGKAWKGLGWFLAGVAVALGFLLVPLQVAAERKKLDKAEAAIAQAKREMRALETEFDTRASLAQLEQWNGDTLRLTAPVAGQFVRDEAALAAIDVHGAPPAAQPGQPGVQMASLVVPSRPTGPATVQAPAPAIHLVAPANPLAPDAPVPSAPAATAAPSTGGMALASAIVTTGAKPAMRLRPAVAMVAAPAIATASVSVPATARRKPQTVALLDRKLLADSSLGDLLATGHGIGSGR